jgi:ABC-2 type transport system ATP-binding protein
MRNDLAIKVENINKTFELPHEKDGSIKSAIINMGRRNKSFETQRVLQDISFEVKKGEFFGIIGRNGSGKSTLLKILAGIYSPDSGTVSTFGKLTPFIELGVGFSPELTGRENVFLNGALLGFNRKEMQSMYGDIVEFAGLEKSMDQKLKNYSSGMQVRLAFSIAIRAETDILVLDEVLAVGDENFQKKCLEVFREYKSSDKTIILVSHGVGDIEKFCDRVLVLENSKQLGVFSSKEAINLYQELNFEQNNRSKTVKKELNKKNRWGTSEFIIKNITITDNKLTHTGKELEISLIIEAKKIASNDRPITVGLAFYDEEGINISGPNSNEEELTFSKNMKDQNVKFIIPKNPLNKGTYRLTAGLFDSDAVVTYDYWIDATTFSVVSDIEYAGKIIINGRWKIQ